MDKALLYKYFQGHATDSETEEILNWLDKGEGHRKQFEKERFLFDVTLFASEKEDSKETRKWEIIRPFMRAVAFIAVIIGCTLILQHILSSPAVYTQSIMAPIGQQTEVTLPDGTKVRLNSKTSLSYQTDFGKKDRNVKLDGEAYFEVTKNRKLPFHVITSNKIIEVKGTHFNICAYRNSPLFEAALYQGSIDIYDSNLSRKAAHLTPGLCYQDNNGVIDITTVTSIIGRNWDNGIISFSDVTFPDLMQHLSSYYDIKVIISDEKMRNYKCTGKFRIADGLDHILNVIQKDQQFHYTYNQSKRTIIIQ